MFKYIKRFATRTANFFNFQILGKDGKPLRDTYSPLIEPDENKDFAFKQTNEGSIKNMTVSAALRTLIKD